MFWRNATWSSEMSAETGIRILSLRMPTLRPVTTFALRSGRVAAPEPERLYASPEKDAVPCSRAQSGPSPGAAIEGVAVGAGEDSGDVPGTGSVGAASIVTGPASAGVPSVTVAEELSAWATSGAGEPSPSEPDVPADPVDAWARRASAVIRNSEPAAPVPNPTVRAARAAAVAAPGPFRHMDAITRAMRSTKLSSEPPSACRLASGRAAAASSPPRLRAPQPTRSSGGMGESNPRDSSSGALRGSAVHANVKTLLRPSFSPIGITAGAGAATYLLLVEMPPPKPEETG